MVFIVSDQRIATENFEKGKIYKVVFLDESIFYGVCLGIGSNFVMLSGNISGYLFSLTMETASQVESIDLFDPTPPEPPVPWTNLLHYQTGEPPFTFNTTDNQLFSWYIIGAGVGDKTANLAPPMSDGWVNGYVNASTGEINQPTAANEKTSDYIDVHQYSYVSNCYENGDFPSTGTSTSTTAWYCLGCYREDKTFISRLVNKLTYELPAETYYVRMSFRTFDETGNVMVNGGDTQLLYEPYGYKIPILCNEHLTNIYLDAPLEEDEILYSTDLDTVIITDIGDNTLSVLTEAQPSEMQIVYKIADR